MSAELIETAAQVRAAVQRLHDRAREAGAESTADDLGKMLRAADNLRGLLDQLPERTVQAMALQDSRKLRHDLRTPVNQILGYGELLLEEAEDESEPRWVSELDAIHSDTRALLKLVDRVGIDNDAPVAATIRRSSAPERAAVGKVLGTILVVDDNRANRELLERRLARDGYAAITADNGVEALRVVRSQRIDVVLLDIMMPVMDGYETLERLKSDPELRHLPVIMLTSLDEPDSITRCIQQGAEDHLPKPFDPVLLRARIGSSLEKKKIRDLEREYLVRIVAEKRRADDLLHGVIPIGVALTAERDFNRLLERVLREARRFCGADGGGLFLRKDDDLEHVQLQCDSVELRPGDATEGRGDKATLVLRVPEHGRLRPAAKAALGGAMVNLGDVYEAEDLDLSAVKAFDSWHGYRTQSLVALPLRGAEGEVIGVLELWNATRATDDAVVPFNDGMLEVLESLSRLAGAALECYRRETVLRRRIRHLEIRVDEANRRREVSQITETDYFRNLRDMAQKLRASAKSGADG
ncbi:MAG: response regulator [Myxococcota bacterium]